MVNSEEGIDENERRNIRPLDENNKISNNNNNINSAVRRSVSPL